MDFSVSQLPGWHTTIFPPYFVAGAVFSGFGMVLTLLVPLRRMLHLEDIIRVRHIELMCKVTLATGSIVGCTPTPWNSSSPGYSGDPYEKFLFLNMRLADPYIIAPLLHVKTGSVLVGPYWTMVSCNVLVPQLFWFKKVRTSMFTVFILSILVNVGMWFERFVIIAVSLPRRNSCPPTGATTWVPSWVDVLQFLGTFRTVFHLLPAISAIRSAHRHRGGQGRDHAG